MALQRRVVEPHGQHHQDERRRAHPQQLTGKHVRQEVHPPLQRDALGRIRADLVLARRQAVPVQHDLVVVHAQEDDHNQRQGEDVQQVEAQQTARADIRRTAQQQVDVLAHDLRRRGFGHAGADRHRPEGELVPGQQVAGKAQEEGGQQQDHAGRPGKLARPLVAAGDVRAQHMQHHRHDHGLRPQAVNVAHELAEGHIAQQVEHVVVGGERRRRVEHHQEHAGDDLNDEEVGRQPAQAQGRIHTGHGGMIVAGPHVHPEAVGVGGQAGVGPPAGRFPAQHLADVPDVQTGGDPRDGLVNQVEDRSTRAFFLDVIQKGRERQNRHGLRSSTRT